MKKRLFSTFFSNREIRGLLLFLPLAGLLALGLWLARPKSDPEAAERLAAEIPVAGEAASGKTASGGYAENDAPVDRVELFRFDPNTIDYRGLRRLGLSKGQAASLLRYREAGKVFRIPEDVAMCYGFNDSLFFRLEPYIYIGAEYAAKPRRYTNPQDEVARIAPEPFRIDTASALYLRAVAGLKKREAEAMVERRIQYEIRDMEELRRCYGVTDSMAAALEPYVIFPRRNPFEEKVELNRADSAALRSVRGIGEKSVVAILRYRERLGGFYRVEQLSEIPQVTESNYNMILKQITCDSCEIQKIDINFASPNELSGHPYIPPGILRKLLKARQLKGGWTSAGDLVTDEILTHEEAARLAPYLRFVEHKTQDN